MEQDELIANLQKIVVYFTNLRDTTEDSEEYAEYNIAIITITQTIERLLTITSLGYALKLLQSIADAS